MARNIEIKASLAQAERQHALARAIATESPAEIFQEDVFFNVPAGRLKLRYLGPANGELISYQRADQQGPKTSSYEIFRTEDPSGLERVLTASLGVRGRVRKKRVLYMVGRTRVHLDDVEGLGSFLELEVVLREGERAETGEAEAQDLMKKLEIDPSRLETCAYMDLLEKKARDQN